MNLDVLNYEFMSIHDKRKFMNYEFMPINLCTSLFMYEFILVKVPDEDPPSTRASPADHQRITMPRPAAGKSDVTVLRLDNLRFHPETTSKYNEKMAWFSAF